MLGLGTAKKNTFRTGTPAIPLIICDNSDEIIVSGRYVHCPRCLTPIFSSSRFKELEKCHCGRIYVLQFRNMSCGTLGLPGAGNLELEHSLRVLMVAGSTIPHHTGKLHLIIIEGSIQS
jgi:hypothetical protein